jgi:hypothetical protein
MKRLLLLVLLAGLAYWFVRTRMGGQADEFTFTEAPAEGEAQSAEPAAEPQPAEPTTEPPPAA